MHNQHNSFALKPIHWFLFIVFVLVWMGSLEVRALITPDEGRYATISFFMAKTGDWITPRLNGILYFEKPIWQYWMGAIAFKLFGANNFAARFWPGLSGLGTVLFTAWVAAKIWNRQIGLYAFCITASMLWIIGNSHFLTLDMGLTFFLTLALGFFLLAQTTSCSKAQRNFNWLAWAAIALATLSKGLVALVIPGTSAIIYMLIERDWRLLARMHMGSGLVVFLLISVPWFWVVSERNTGFAHFFFIHEHFDRYLSKDHHRNGPLYYFVPVLILGMMPWTTWLFGLFGKSAKVLTTHTFDARRFLLIWTIFTFVFFSLSKSKLPSYILPIFPALAMLIACRLQTINRTGWLRHMVLPGLFWLGAIVAFGFVEPIAHLTKNPQDIVHQVLELIAVGGVFGLGGVMLGIWFSRKEKMPAAVISVAMGSLIGFSCLLSAHDPYGHLKSSVDVAPLFKKDLPADAPVYSVAYYDQTLPYYLGRTVQLVDYYDEFSFGLAEEPDKEMKMATFEQKWREEPAAGALMLTYKYEELKKAGLPMKVIYRDPQRVAVIKAEPGQNVAPAVIVN